MFLAGPFCRGLAYQAGLAPGPDTHYSQLLEVTDLGIKSLWFPQLGKIQKFKRQI